MKYESIEVVAPSAILITPKDRLSDYSKILELAGRTCYKSEDRITDNSANKFIKNIVRRGHESIIEHMSVTYRITCSRSCSHQLVRHRLASYSQESQRYVNYGKKDKLKVIVPLAIIQRMPEYTIYMENIERDYKAYRDILKSPYCKPEDARYLLPNATATEIVTTMNLRMWRHVIKERGLNPRAQWEIRNIIFNIGCELKQILPAVFGDIKELEESC